MTVSPNSGASATTHKISYPTRLPQGKENSFGRRNDRQHDVRLPLRLVVDRIVRRDHPPVLLQRFARVWVDVEPWEIAARNIEPNAMALGEDVGRRVQVDRHRV